MSRTQTSRGKPRVLSHLHGLVLETSIWQLAGSTRFLGINPKRVSNVSWLSHITFERGTTGSSNSDAHPDEVWCGVFFPLGQALWTTLFQGSTAAVPCKRSLSPVQQVSAEPAFLRSKVSLSHSIIGVFFPLGQALWTTLFQGSTAAVPCKRSLSPVQQVSAEPAFLRSKVSESAFIVRQAKHSASSCTHILSVDVCATEQKDMWSAVLSPFRESPWILEVNISVNINRPHSRGSGERWTPAATSAGKRRCTVYSTVFLIFAPVDATKIDWRTRDAWWRSRAVTLLPCPHRRLSWRGFRGTTPPLNIYIPKISTY